MAGVNPFAVIRGILEVQETVGEFIANGPSDGIAGYVRDKYRERCDQAANVPPWLLALSPSSRRSLKAFCDPYWQQSGVDGFVAEPPFTGGQCPTFYTVNIGGNNFDISCNLVPFTGQVQGVRGPIRGVRFIARTSPLPNPNCGDRGVFQIQNGSGVWETVAAGGQGGLASAGITSVVRGDGQSDNCGDLPTEIKPGPTPPPDPGPTPGPEPTDDPDGGPFPRIPIPPFSDPFGDFPFDFPGLDDGLGGGSGGGGGGGAPPGDVGEPGQSEDTGEGGDADGEAPEGSVIVGLKIDFAAEPRGGVEYRPGVYRGVCYVYMGTDEGLDHDPAGAMLRSGQFVYAEKDNLTRWAVSANRGYNLRVTPYYRQVETEG